jgi:ubiquinone/menaquinone biosynthesis C-methylase UbiE
VSGWFDLPRVPEPEVMDDAGEVEAYSDSAAQEYLSKIDDSFVLHALRVVGAPRAVPDSGRALDIGTGPGQIVRKLARYLPGWEFVGVDRSPSMICEALAGPKHWKDDSANEDGEDQDPGTRVEFLLADGGRLPFGDASFDLVICNSVLHHFERPGLLLAEIARVARPTGAILLRDLRRPSRLAYPLHVRWYGRHYNRLMYKLYCDSVRAAYTPEELAAMSKAETSLNARVFIRGRTHLGLERFLKVP